MSKQILPFEIAQITAGLLVNPEILGINPSPETHKAFMLDVGKAIAKHFGGRVNFINDEMSPDPYLSSLEASPTLSVSPTSNESTDVVWFYHDVQGWGDDHVSSQTQHVESVRQRLQSCLITDKFNIPFKLEEKAHDGPSISGNLLLEGVGLSISFDGHTDCDSEYSKGFPVFLELYEGEVYTRVYANAATDEPTHNICLKNARNEYRPDD